MKKRFGYLFLAVLLIILVISTPFAANAQEPAKKAGADAEKNISELLSAAPLQPVPDQYKTGLESIVSGHLKSFVAFLSSDLLEGRDTASRGYDLAAEYVANLFSQWGVKPAGDWEPQPVRGRRFEAAEKKEEKPRERVFFQEIPMKDVESAHSSLKVEARSGGRTLIRQFSQDSDFNYYPRSSETVSAPAVFVGYGISEAEIQFDELKGLDLKGKVVIMLDGLPGADNPSSPFNDKKFQEKYGAQSRSNRFRPSPKIKPLQDRGAALILTVTRSTAESDVPADKLRRLAIDDSRPIMEDRHRRVRLTEAPNLKMPWDGSPSAQISRETAKSILDAAGFNLDDTQEKIDKGLKPNSFVLPSTTITMEALAEEKLVRCRNVVGYVEGADPKLKDEFVVIGAHLDHLGRNGDYIFNGADDNASGSAGVMALARAFVLNPVKPKRSVIFALWTGEEKGLLGSIHYVLHPFAPLKKTVAYINLDMISHAYKKDDLQLLSRYLQINVPEEKAKTMDMNLFLPVTFSRAHEKHHAEMFREINRYLGMELFIHSTEQTGGGSDHAAFVMFNVPIISFHTSMTEDYHRQTDSLDKIDPAMMERVARLIYLTAFKTADADLPAIPLKPAPAK